MSSNSTITDPPNGASELARQRAAVLAAKTCSFLFDPEGRLRWFNPVAAAWVQRYFDHPIEEGHELDAIFPAEAVPAFRENFKTAAAGTHCRFDCSFLYEGAEQRRYHVRITPLISDGGATEAVLIEVADVGPRTAGGRSLWQNDELFRSLVQNSSDVVTVLDATGHIRYMSPAVEQILGFPGESLVGMDALKLVHPDDVHRLNHEFHMRDLGAGMRASCTYRVQHADGSWLTMESIASNMLHMPEVAGFVLNTRDITERQRHAAEMHRAARLESLGVLAGGIAHDFNNILLAIIGNLSLARLSANGHEELQGRLRDAEKASLRARDLTQQLLTFSKGGAPIRNTHHLAEIIRDSIEFVLHGCGTETKFELEEGLWPVEADAGQISQVLNNLAINALHAMDGAGTLTVRAHNAHVPAEDSTGLCPGRYVRIEVADTGTGIPPEILPRLFEPFFTTKTSGSGLGLATAYSIVRQHEGHIEVDTHEGAGTTFILHLPASDRKPVPDPDETQESLIGSGSLLLMDDDEDIRRTVSELLETFGYKVTTAIDGRELLEKYANSLKTGDPFRVVIMDLTVPGGMGGYEATQRLRQIDPGVKTIVSSGYSNDTLMAEFRQHGFDGMVAKPYKTEALARVIRDVLAPKQAAP